MLARRFYLIGDMTNHFYPFIRGLLEWPFSEVFSANLSLWNQCKYIAFNIFSCRILLVSYNMLIITGIYNEKNKRINHIWTIISKRHNILQTKPNFFISSAGKIASVHEFKIKLFEQLFHCKWQPSKNCMATCSSFQRTWYFAFLR